LFAGHIRLPLASTEQHEDFEDSEGPGIPFEYPVSTFKIVPEQPILIAIPKFASIPCFFLTIQAEIA